jgi:hypothetical protein
VLNQKKLRSWQSQTLYTTYCRKMTNRIHRPLKVIAFNANGISKQRYELSIQLQDLHTDVVLFSDTHLKSHGRFYIPNVGMLDTRCSANAWAFSVGLLVQVPCGVRRGGEGFVACFRYLVVFHKE